MEFRNINTFIKTAEYMNFTKAAEELGYSQSAVTVQIRQLESEIGVMLFERIGKTVTLTAEGQQFLDYAYELNRMMHKAENFARKKAEVVDGLIRVGTAESVGTRLLPNIIRKLHRRYPLVKLVVYMDVTADLLHKLRHNQLDIVYFDEHSISDADLVKPMEIKDDFCVVCSSRHVLAGRDCSLGELIQHPFILTEKGVSYRHAFDQLLARNGLSLVPFLEVGNTDLIVDLVKSNLGISLLPAFTVKKELDAGSLSVITVPDYEIPIYRQLIYHKNKWLTPALEHFIKIVKIEGERFNVILEEESV